MESVTKSLSEYIRQTIGVQATATPWPKCNSLPLYLRENYRYFRLQLLETECLLMIHTGTTEQPPTIIGKHMEQVRHTFDGAIIYVRPAVTSYHRQRLIERKIPFIIPGNQMYLPMLGLDLREHFKKMQKPGLAFSPATQALVLHILWQKEKTSITPAAIAHRLGYSAMTMTRAFNELEAAGLGAHSVQGKERHLCFAETGQQLWEKVRPGMQSPIKKRMYIITSRPPADGLTAGDSALAEYTSLAEPEVPVLAFTAETWSALMRRGQITEVPAPETGGYTIEIWKYSPALFARRKVVDRLSLYLAFRDNPDERVQSALDELLAGMPW